MAKYKCKFCSFIGQNLNALKTHSLYLHFNSKQQLEKNYIEKINKQIFMCKFCSFISKKIYLLNKHISKKHKNFTIKFIKEDKSR